MPFVLKTRVDLTSYDQATRQITEWARTGTSRYVCVANVHMVMEAYLANLFARVVNGADLVVPDGMPLVWVLRLKGFRGQERVYGPALMLAAIGSATEAGFGVGFYGGRPEVLDQLTRRLTALHPGLKVHYSYSPPFRELTVSEDEAVCEAIRESGARIMFIGLGCPKQERWMADHRDRFPGVMIGVGAAFDFIAGTKRQAPPWMQRGGLEWFFRLSQEPRRLWKRYLIYNPLFLVLALMDLVRSARR